MFLTTDYRWIVDSESKVADDGLFTAINGFNQSGSTMTVGAFQAGVMGYFAASNVNDIFTGKGGDDRLEGDFGYDRANYGGATGGINVQLPDGADSDAVRAKTVAIIDIEITARVDRCFDRQKCRRRPARDRLPCRSAIRRASR